MISSGAKVSLRESESGISVKRQFSRRVWIDQAAMILSLDETRLRRVGEESK